MWVLTSPVELLEVLARPAELVEDFEVSAEDEDVVDVELLLPLVEAKPLVVPV